MSSEFDAVGYKMEYANDTSIVNSCQSIEFVHDGYTLCFVVGGAYQVCYTVNDHKMNSTVFVMKQVHTLTNDFQSVLA